MNRLGSKWLYRLSNLGLIFVLVAGLALGNARPVEAVSPIYVDDSWVGTTPGVDPDGVGPATNFGADSFATIQEGVTAVDAGGTVQVYAGTYTEQISINKNLTLTGEDKLTTIIEAPAVMSEACNTSVSLPNRPILCVDSSANATIQGFTFDGLSLGSTNLRMVGVAFRNAGGVVQDNIIQNIGFGTWNGAEEGVGIYLFNSDSPVTARTINIIGNTITGFNKNGITLTSHEFWSLLTFLVDGNTITGFGPNQTIVQNGIQVELPRGSGTISGNTISNIAFNNSNNPQALVAVSILNLASPDNPNTTTTTGNIITGAQGGAYYFDGQGLISYNTIAVVNPSSTGLTGKIAFGIMATDPPWAVLSPYDSTYIPGEVSTNGLAVEGSPPPISVEVAGNTISFSGADNTNTAGITSEAGIGANELDLNVHDNTVSGFAVGVEFHQCEPTLEACSTGSFSSIRAVSNNLSNNVTGLTFFGPIDDVLTPLVSPIEVHHNRFFGNTTGLSNETYSGGDMNTPILIVAANNWWGCNAGPGNVDCDSFDAFDPLKVDAVPWLVMTAAAIPGPINLSGTAPFAVDLNHNSALEFLTPGDTVLDTVPVAFSVTTLGSVLPTASFYTSGDATTTFTAPTTIGTYAVCATTDNQSVCSNVTVEDFNDPPVITGQSPLSTPEETPLEILLTDLTITDPDDTSFVLTVLPGSNYGVSGTAITPALNFVGDLTVNVTVNDGEVDSAVFGLLVTVTAVNDAPVANDQSVGTPYQTDLAITLTMSDVDGGSPVTWTIIDSPQHGSLSGTAPNLTYTPGAGYNGSDSFTFKVNDGGADSNVATVTITVASQITYTILLPVILK